VIFYEHTLEDAVSRGLVLAFVLLGAGAFHLAGKATPPKTPTPPQPMQQIAAIPAPLPALPVASPPLVVQPRSIPAAAPTRSLFVTGNDVALRAEPQPRGTILDRVAKGRDVLELKREGDWVQVRHPISAREGWMPARFLSDQAPKLPEEPKAKVPDVPILAGAVVTQRLLAESRASYPGSCACPEDRDRAGRRCGARSAYSRPGGYQPLCYPSDVTQAMIAEYRQKLQ
jgi:hypothetical protein